MKYNYKRNIKLFGGALAGSTLGFIHNNTLGAVAGGVLAYKVLDNILPNE